MVKNELTNWSILLCYFCTKRNEREIKQKLEEQEETALNMTETYNSLQQEVEVKTKKLKKVQYYFGLDLQLMWVLRLQQVS